jgi:enoyl-CoA hydratase/carnithine racemase
METQSPPPSVLASRHGALGLITLNRPQALNALDRAMCVAIHAALDQFAVDPAVRAVAIEGAGERAFCAGGDVVAMHRAGREGLPDWEAFFATEYRMNHAIAVFPKPCVALMDGVTMGGGVGVSIHGSHRVATERTLWAMPETGIGMIPDVGSTVHLGRMGPLGRFLALTGARLDRAEALAAGVATHFVASERLEALKAALAGGADVDAALAGHAGDPGAARLAGNRAAIDRLFATGTVEAILAALDADGSDWAAKEAATIRRMSPIACKLALELLARGARGDTADALRNEYRVVCALKHGHDFFEGVRAQLIDKDRAPRWRPAELEAIGRAMVESHFREPEGGDLSL